MHSVLEIDEYIFDTAALHAAVRDIDQERLDPKPAFSQDALVALFEYFCDWGPTREGDINASVAEGLSSLAMGEQEALFDRCCEVLAENLRDQYGVDARSDAIQGLAVYLAGDTTERPGLYDFLLDYLWEFSRHLRDLDPNKNASIDSAQNLLNQTRNLPSPYLDAKRTQYSGSSKVNEIRYRLLEAFRADGEIGIEVLQSIKREVQEKYDSDILQAWRDYTILAQVYYDYYKPRIDVYLDALAERITDEFDDYELETHVVNFQGAQNYVSDIAWIAAHTPPKRSQKDKYQLFLGILGDHLSVGLHVGSNRREGDWETNRDLEELTDPNSVSFGDILAKLHAVEDDFALLSGLTPGPEPNGDPERPDRADEIARQLASKKQVVFYGPPGTGKTYVAQRFANWWIEEQDVDETVGKRVRTVTFHPSFTYEDFVEGLTVETTDDGEVVYEVQDGQLKRICQDARADFQKTPNDTEPPRYVLVIDEINRGNLAQIFGETITLLEADKRNETYVDLAHSGSEGGQGFTIPPNLYVIGTMNTADRSIALVDAALRRRFRFIGFQPDCDVLCEDLGFDDIDAAREAVRAGSDAEDALAGLSIVALERINRNILQTPDLGKGKQIGHSYLMNLDSGQAIVDAWQYDILPLLEEYHFGQFDRIREEIFDGLEGELIDWEQERIRSFDESALMDTLSAFVDIDPNRAALIGADAE